MVILLLQRSYRWFLMDMSGVAALEYALVAPVFVLFVFGIMETSRLAWTQITLERAVYAAARCGALSSPQCSTAVDIASYTRQSAVALNAATSAVQVEAATCGIRVSITHIFMPVVPLGTQRDMTLTASACSPFINSATP